MGNLALYRKYRSQTFSDLIGQEHVVRALQNGIGQGRISHAYLFTGPRGTGKTSSARLLAKALNCEKGPAAEPCNECGTCLEITAGHCMDVVEMDAASDSGVGDVRESIVEVADYQPASCRYKVFIIDEVHDLSRQAFDALLKTIEEPPDHLVFVLATTEFSKVPPTIRSRCQRFDFHRGSIKELVERLRFVVESEGQQADPAALGAIARMSDGGFRDALTLLEQALLTCDGHVTLEHVYDQLGLVNNEVVDTIFGAMAAQDTVGLVNALDDTFRLGRDPRSLLESMLYRLSDLTRAALSIEVGGFEDATQEAALRATALSLGVDTILRYRAALAEAHRLIRDVTLPRVWLEAELLRISPPGPQADQQAPPKEGAQKVVEPEPRAQAKPAEPPPTTGDPELDQARTQWASLVGELSQMSAVAKERLAGTRLDRLENGVAHVAFARNVHLEMVAGSKLEKAIRESWTKKAGDAHTLSFFFGNDRPAVTQAVVEPTAVELPMEGDRLVETVHEVFGAGTGEKG